MPGAVLVTGATGFIGSRLVRRLVERGAQVRALVRNLSNARRIEGLPVEITYGDVTDYDSVRKAVRGCKIVYHLAAFVDLRNRHREEIWRVNVEGTHNVATAALEEEVDRFVHTSTVGAVGASPDGRLVDETWAYNLGPLDVAYFDAKRKCEEQVLKLCGSGLPAVVVNPSFVLGPPDGSSSNRHIVARIARSAWMRTYLPGGLNIVDVDDVVEGHIAACEKGRAGERYILGGHNLSYKELYTLVAEHLSLPRPLFRAPYPLFYAIASLMAKGKDDLNRLRSLKFYWYYDSSKAQRELGFRPTELKVTMEKIIGAL